MYLRALDLASFVAQRSVLLLGPRQTGKSTLLRTLFPDARYVDLLEADTHRQLLANPERLRQSLSESTRVLIIDEVQKLPGILDEVQLLIDRNRDLRVILTGSSARKLVRGGANLLAGRVWVLRLHPLVSTEVGGGRLAERLIRGSLPGVLDSPNPVEDLRAYVGTYLREEIQAEALTRSIGAFARFIDIAGMQNGRLLRFSEVASDCGVPARTVREWYQLLSDTLLGHQIEPWAGRSSRKVVATPKYYLFDTGVAATLQNRTSLAPGTAEWGNALEHQVLLELLAWNDYRRKGLPITFWRTHTQEEVDFVLGDDVAIEVKATASVTSRMLSGMRAFGAEATLRRRIVACHEKEPRKTDDGIEIWPVEMMLEQLWGGGIA